MDAATPDWSRYAARDHLVDGRAILVRAIRPDDKQALAEGLQRFSPQSAYSRFFCPKRGLSCEELAYFTEVDFRDHVALVAALDDGGGVVGVGRYILCETQPRRCAEIAFAVDEAFRGQGIATLLLRHLATIARASALVAFRASVLAENRKMLAVLRRSGLPQQCTVEQGVAVVRLGLGE